MRLAIIALAPVVFILIYIFLRDKYEHEPVGMLLKAFFFGCLTVVPVMFVEMFLQKYVDAFSQNFRPFYDAFVVAGFSEELFKYLMFIWVIWRNRNFNEHFEGIVYAVFVSLGFAAVENVMYVFSQGPVTGVVRAFTAVPAHALFGVAMGYYFSKAKFSGSGKAGYIILALFIPIIFHGIYDWILFSGYTAFSVVFIVYLAYLWRYGFKRLREMSDQSQFNQV